MILDSILLVLIVICPREPTVNCLDPIFKDGIKNSIWWDADPFNWNYLYSNDWNGILFPLENIAKVVICSVSFNSCNDIRNKLNVFGLLFYFDH